MISKEGQEGEPSVILDISFFRSKNTFNKLLLLFLIKLNDFGCVNNDIYIIVAGTTYLILLESLGAIDLGIIKDNEINIHFMKINLLKLLSNDYIIYLLKEHLDIWLNVEWNIK